MKAPIRNVQDIPHRAGCRAVKSAQLRYGRSPWGPVDYGDISGGHPRTYRDRNGRGHAHGYTPFLRFRCNDIECGAILLVSESDIADFVEGTR